jgi:hypothetical protein
VVPPGGRVPVDALAGQVRQLTSSSPRPIASSEVAFARTGVFSRLVWWRRPRKPARFRLGLVSPLLVLLLGCYFCLKRCSGERVLSLLRAS